VEGSDPAIGTPGASARREHARRKAQREARARAKHPRFGGLILGLQRSPAHEDAWLTGAEGEEIVARRLEKRVADGVVLLHDRRLPGSLGNVDHIAVARSGVWVIDTKRYTGRVAVKRPLFGDAKLMIAGRDRTNLIAGLARQVEMIRGMLAELHMEVPVRGALCFVDAELPLFRTLTIEGYLVTRPRRLARRINEKGKLVWPELPGLASALAARLPLA
jgi:hypothetical protein